MVSPREENQEGKLQDMVAAERSLWLAVEKHGEDSEQAQQAKRELDQISVFAGVAEPL